MNGDWDTLSVISIAVKAGCKVDLCVINYFENRATNASDDSFNAKVKALRSQFRGVREIPLFNF